MMSGNSNHNTVSAAIRAHAAKHPDRIAFTFLKGSVAAQRDDLSYARLDHQARRLAAALQAGGYTGKPILICCPPGPEFVIALLGCAYAGAIATPCFPPNFRLESRSTERLTWLCQTARPALAITSAAQLDKARWHSNNQLLRLRWLALCDELDELASPESWQDPQLNEDAPALLQYTSGSTAEPKGVIVTQKNLMANARFTVAKLGLNTQSRCVSWLPPYHDMGLFGATLVPLIVGFPTVQMPPTQFLARPRQWLAAISEFRGSISPAPNFAYDYCVDRIPSEARAGLDLSCWTHALNGAEPIRADTMERFAQAFAASGFERKHFVPCYGMAESTLMISANASGDPRVISASVRALSAKVFERSGQSKNSVNLVSCGNLASDNSVQIVDPKTATTTLDGHVGEIWVNSDSVAKGYWRNEAASQSVFHARLVNGPCIPAAFRKQLWLRTGDLGLRLDGELYVTGRLKDLIIVRGRNYYPTDLEQYASASHPALATDGAAAFSIDGGGSESVVLLLEIQRRYRKSAHQLDCESIALDVQRTVLERFDLTVDCIHLLKPGSLARTTSGKLRRSECGRQYKTHGFAAQRIAASSTPPSDAAATKTVGAWHERLSALVTSILRQPNHLLPIEHSMADLGLDSLKRMELAVLLESELGIAPPLDALTPESTLSELNAWLESTCGAVNQGPLPVREPAGKVVPLLPAQRRFLHEANHKPQQSVIVAYLRTPTGIGSDTIHDAIAALPYQYDALRLRFRRSAGAWQQTLAPAKNAFGYERLLASDLNRDGRADLRNLLWERLYTHFDLERDPPAQAIWLDRGPAETGILAVRLHHLISDGTSEVALLHTLEKNLRAVTAKQMCPIAPVDSPSFAAWSRGLAEAAIGHEVESEHGYWRDTCTGAPTPRLADAPPPVTTGTSDHTRPFSQTAAATLGPAQTRQFEHRHPSSMTQYAVIVAAATAAWKCLTGQDDVLLELENHGRHAVYGLTPSIAVGWMACFYPLRLQGIGTTADAAALSRVERAFRAVPNHGLGYGLLRHTRGMLEGLPTPRIAITHRGRLDETSRQSRQLPVLGLGEESNATSADPSKPHWRLLTQISGGSLRLSITYRTSLCRVEDVTNWRDETMRQIQNLMTSD
ncbi:AMP-binding protein [bacterium]|nr:AMP-binding protein [bacterium]